MRQFAFPAHLSCRSPRTPNAPQPWNRLLRAHADISALGTAPTRHPANGFLRPFGLHQRHRTPGNCMNTREFLDYNQPMRIPCSLFATAILALSVCAVSLADTSQSDLDSIARQAVAQSQVVGASVLVAKGDHILLLQGYGVSDIGLEAPSKADSVYHVVGPLLPFTGVP